MNSKKDRRARLSETQMIEWQVCEDESDWHTAQAQPHEKLTVEVQRQHWRQKRLLRWGIPSLLVVLVLALSGGRWLWGRAQRGLDETETELEVAVITELLSASPTRIPTKAALQERSVLSAVRLDGDVGEMIKHLEILDLGTDWAIIEVLIQPTMAGPTYRQTRVYHYSNRGWIREEATAEHWGVARQLESNYFVFHYHALDEEAVTLAAARLDALYVTLNASFYGRAPAAEKLTITVNPAWLSEEARQQSGSRQVRDGALVVASPASMLVPVEAVPGDVLLQSLFFPLFSEEAAAHHPLSQQWPDMINGLRLWLIWELELPLAVWRKPLVQWVFSDSPRAAWQESFVVPDFAHNLCQQHRLWMRSPLEIAVPIHCDSQAGGEEKIMAWRYRQPPLEIPLSTLIYKSELMDNLSAWHYVPQPAAAAVALATTLEYIASTYGPARVQQLLAAVPEHEAAETLIPAVFGVPLAEFESGWRAFLQEEYEITP